MKNLQKNQIVRTRFAPSPTGDLHVGNARTALFNYLFAKHYNGKFILRIEDTDDERNIADSEFTQEKELKKLKIFPDESFSNPGNFGPYKQSQKSTRYLELAESLVKKQKAYCCFCSEKDLEEGRKIALQNNSTPIYSKKCRNLTPEQIEEKIKNGEKYVIRLKTDILDSYSWEDMIRGTITVPSSALGDFVLIRSNKKATYNFAVVVDDSDMQITHILRGEDHISNTPYQLAAYHALEISEVIPNFAHISMVVNEKREKLSKRSADEMAFVSTYQKKGYPPDAIINFLALLSWSHGEKEIYSIDEIINLFDISSLSASPSVFDIDKLNWISHKYFQNMDENYYLNFVKGFFLIDLKENNSMKSLFATLHKDRINCADELNVLAQDFYSVKQFTKEQIAFLKENIDLLKYAQKHFPTSDDWNITDIRGYLKQLMELSSAKGPKFFKPLRLSFCFMEEGLSIQDVLLLNGKNKSWNNLNLALKMIEHESS